VRIEVATTGLHRIPYASLPLADLGTPVIAPYELRLTCGGKDVPLRVVAANGHAMAAGDYVEFYGQALGQNFSDTNVYRLSWDGRSTRRMRSADGTPGTGTATITDFQDRLHLEENHMWYSLTPGAPAQDYWFWAKLTSPVQWDQAFTIPAIGAGTVTVQATFQGLTDLPATPDHRTVVLVNGTQISDESWDGQSAYTQVATLPDGLLHSGSNTLSVSLPNSTLDQIYVNAFDITWTRPIAAVNDKVRFTVSGTGTEVIQATGFTGSDIQVYDVTDPADPRRIQGAAVSASGGGYKVVFADQLAGTTTYVATTAAACLNPSTVAAWTPSGIRRSHLNAADWILITPRAFLDAAQPLVRFRQDQGLRAVAVAVEDIYSEFADGVADPSAIQAFLTYAHANWTAPAPAYVLLLGDATLDFKNGYGYGKVNRVPPHFSWTSDLGLTPDDNWYVTLGDPGEMPAMAIGRIPAASAAAAGTAIQKVIAYEQSATATPSRALLVADDQDSTFQASAELMAQSLPASLTPQKVYMSSVADAATAHTAILGAFNGGVHLAAYFGHGNTTFWTRNIFQNSDISLLSNGSALPFLMSFDCLNGYFAIYSMYSLGETLVADPSVGAVAVFASSGLGYNWEHEILGNLVFKAVCQNGKRVLGDICAQAKIDAYGQGASLDLVRMFTLLGDPAMKLKPLP